MLVERIHGVVYSWSLVKVSGLPPARPVLALIVPQQTI